MPDKLPEVWMRGPIPGVPPFLQPVAHALLQAVEEIQVLLIDFPNAQLWERPAGRASVGFHLQHITGVLDRMSAYAEGRPLTEQQFTYLAGEAVPPYDGCAAADLAAQLYNRVHQFVAALHHIPDDALLQPRGIGRRQLPTTVLGLLFHAAEHTQRHLGQLVVTVSVVKGN